MVLFVIVFIIFLLIIKYHSLILLLFGGGIPTLNMMMIFMNWYISSCSIYTNDWLATLTSRTKNNAQMKIDDRYKGRAKALSKAGLYKKYYKFWMKFGKKQTLTQSGEREVEDEYLICIFVLLSLRYSLIRFTTSLKSFVITKFFNAYVRGCHIICYQA